MGHFARRVSDHAAADYDPLPLPAYRGDRLDGFFEWKAIKAQKAKQPYAIDMTDRSPFGIAEAH